MEADGHPVASASRQQMNDRYSTAVNDRNVPTTALAAQEIQLG
jgi:hypothetical protein